MKTNLRATTNTEFSDIKPLLCITRKLILDQEDDFFFGVSTIDWDQAPWMRSILLHEDAVNSSTVKVYVFSDSVLCLGGVQSSANRLDEFKQSTPHRELDNVDGEPIVFEWTIFPGHSTLTLLQEVERSHSARRFQGSNHVHVDVQRH